MKNADYIIDLGPLGGDRGGEIVAEGTPEEIALVEHSFTGQYLREALKDRLQSAQPARNGNGKRRAPQARGVRNDNDDPAPRAKNGRRNGERPSPQPKNGRGRNGTSPKQAAARKPAKAR
jgi:excinuclease ABC subunit A